MGVDVAAQRGDRGRVGDDGVDQLHGEIPGGSGKSYCPVREWVVAYAIVPCHDAP
jgi:hypothetical protein